MNNSQKKKQFESEYKELFDFVYRYVAFRVPSTGECEDIVGGVFLDAYARIQQYDPDKGSLRQWLSGIARYAVIDYWRARKITLNIDDVLHLCDAYSADNKQHDQSIDATRFMEEVFASLSHEMRYVFTLRYIDDCTYEEIAEIIGKKPNTIRKAFSNMHKRLKGDVFLKQLIAESI